MVGIVHDRRVVIGAIQEVTQVDQVNHPTQPFPAVREHATRRAVTI
jgi:hypothetical protein